MIESAPFVATPAAPVPKGGQAEWFEGANGVRLRAALFPAKGKARGSVVLSPGRTEPLDKYFEVIGELTARGFVVLVHDWRGQGLSDRQLSNRLKGHVNSFSAYVNDYSCLLDTFADRLPRPWIQMGHSMGGCVSLLALAKGEKRFVASALSAPMLSIVSNDYGLIFARLLTWACLGLGLSGRVLFGDAGDPFKLTFEKDRITHDRARWERYHGQIKTCPDLAVGNLTWGWLNAAFDATAFLRKDGAALIGIPVLIAGAGDDDRVITEETRKFAAKLAGGTYVEIPGAWHEILMETDDLRAQWWTAFDRLAAAISPNA